MTTPKKPPLFQKGEIVRLKSGGPRMTISAVHDWRDMTESTVTCTWFSGSKRHDGVFSIEVLDTVVDGEEGAMQVARA